MAIRLVCQRCHGELKEGPHDGIVLEGATQFEVVHCPDCLITFSYGNLQWSPAPEPTLQKRIVQWATACFGSEQVNDPRVRAMRLIEESAEFAQSVGVERSKILEIISYVYSRPMGNPFQEMGGVGVTAYAAAESIGAKFDDAVRVEMNRNESKPIEHFKQRNQTKVNLGFK